MLIQNMFYKSPPPPGSLLCIKLTTTRLTPLIVEAVAVQLVRSAAV